MPKTAATKITSVPTYGEKNKRIFLAESKKFASFPDLLHTQKFGFSSFLEEYLLKLFNEASPVYDIAEEKLSLSITDIKVGDALE
jgi:DNA-directed RNA polymerase beta subunit